ncbi:MAG TPA: hypothetical protein VIH61_05340 [Waddliaceae bacterium]
MKKSTSQQKIEELPLTIGDKVFCPITGRPAEIIKIEQCGYLVGTGNYMLYSVKTYMPSLKTNEFFAVIVKCGENKLTKLA